MFSDFCGFFLVLFSSVQKGQNARMLGTNVEMNIREGKLRKLRKTQKLHIRWREQLVTILHEISSSRPSWIQPLPEITNTAIITCGVHIETCNQK